MNTIDIVGGSGFIGTRLVQRLTSNDTAKLNIIDKAPSSEYPDLVKHADVRSVEELRHSLSDGSVLINLAAEHRDDVRPLNLYDEVNVDGARNLCEVARQKGINKIIFTSSVAVYGFAPLGTDETGSIAPFNDYGRTKYEAEEVFRAWQKEDSDARTLVIIRPTVVFGEGNRGNVYNLIKQVASKKFLMIGDGTNRKSMAYVENVAAFIEHALDFSAGVHTYNYVDKPDFTMNELIKEIKKNLGRPATPGMRLPYALGLGIGHLLDGVAKITGKKLPISSIRVKKFCADTCFNTSVTNTGFTPPVSLKDGLMATVTHEFKESGDTQ
mgnify:CR=1 FL=1